MNPLPPLRTVRGPSTPAPTSGLRSPRSLATNGAVPKPAANLLNEAVELGVLTLAARDEFLRTVGTRIAQLSSRELAGEALIGLKVLTRFQVSRILAGQGSTLHIGNYLVCERLESGSAGVVFLGEHPILKRRAALKVVTIEGNTSPEVVDRFFGEARLLAALDHPHIVAVHDAGQHPAENGAAPFVFLALEYVPGGDVERFIYDRGMQPAGVVCEWGRQIASALRVAHAAGLVHRDLKPSNLLMTETRRLKLIDFGLAREFASTRTDSGVLLGSLEFLAPEQLADAATAGPAADVYGLGAVLFWVLTGQLPIPIAATRRDTIAVLRTSLPRRAVEVRRDIPHEVDELLARMLARNPAERPTAAEAETAFAKLADSIDEEGYREALRQAEKVTRLRTTEAGQSRAAILAALAGAVATRPTETVGHQQRVAAYTRILATELAPHDGWPMCADPAFVNDLTRAAAVHDLGLVAVPDEVLTCVGKPIPSDQTVYETHPVAGDRILEDLSNEFGSALPILRVVRAIVRSHHEHWDGSGYPDKLAGDRIPPVARIVAVADAYDTLRRGGSGGRGKSHEDAVGRIVSRSGTMYDPTVVEVLQRCAGEFEKVYGLIADEPVEVELAHEPANPPD